MKKSFLRITLCILALCLLTPAFKAMPAFAAAAAPERVYVGGSPVGMTLKNVGLVIIGKNEVLTKDGLIDTTKGSGIKNGDIIIKAGGKEINTADELSGAVNLPENAGKPLELTLRRQGKELSTTITPALDMLTNTYKAGLWVKEDTLGIGTLTYVCPSGRFGALGHAVTDADAQYPLELLSGKVFNCTITGVTKGVRGRTGELKGVFVNSSKSIGELDKNLTLGVFGKLDKPITNSLYPKPVEVLKKGEVRPGKAVLLTTLSGSQPAEYDIEIVKVNYQNKPTDKSMVIKITDKTLLESTGGIVQGMSGSPILQNGKLVGAVTHVFINDPTRGYAVFAEWMVDAGK